MKLPENAMLDKNNIWFIDDKNIQKTRVVIEHRGYDYISRSEFYHIEGMEDFIAKVDDPCILFGSIRIKKMLQEFYKVENKLSNVDLPLTYYQKNGKAVGLIVPFYQNSISIRNLFGIYGEEFIKFYHHDECLERNLLMLDLEILYRLWEMYDAGIVYLDIHKGNFIVSDNHIKVIDFEPGYVKFKQNDNNYAKIMEKYCQLVNSLHFSLKIRNLLIFSYGSFTETEKDIKRLYKSI